MKCKVSLLLFFYFGILSVSIAQENVENIRSYYKKYSSQVKQCEQENPDCQLYCNTHITNSKGLEWRGSGNYRKEVNFWYDDSPSSCDECGLDGINTLKFISSSSTSGLSTSSAEWLFKDGKLIFYYLKNSGEQTFEYRYYFDNERLIKYIENDLEVEGDKRSDKIKSKAEDLKKSFLLNFK